MIRIKIMCHIRPQKKVIHEVLTLSTTCLGKHHKTKKKAPTVSPYLQYNMRITVCQVMA